MKTFILSAVIFIVASSVSYAAMIEEVGIAGLRCEVWRVDSGVGSIDDRIRCTYSTYDADGVTVRRAVSTTLQYLTPEESQSIQACIETAFSSIYTRGGFPVPTPRPTPDPTPVP